MHSGNITGWILESFVVNKNATRQFNVQEAVMKKVSFDKTILIKLSEQTTTRRVGSLDFREERVTSFDNHHFILPSMKENDHNHLFRRNPPGLLLEEI